MLDGGLGTPDHSCCLNPLAVPPRTTLQAPRKSYATGWAGAREDWSVSVPFGPATLAAVPCVSPAEDGVAFPCPFAAHRDDASRGCRAARSLLVSTRWDLSHCQRWLRAAPARGDGPRPYSRPATTPSARRLPGQPPDRRSLSQSYCTLGHLHTQPYSEASHSFPWGLPVPVLYPLSHPLLTPTAVEPTAVQNCPDRGQPPRYREPRTGLSHPQGGQAVLR